MPRYKTYWSRQPVDYPKANVKQPQMLSNFIMMASAVIYSENILRSIIKWAGAQKGMPTPYPHERIQSHRDSPALLFTTHPLEGVFVLSLRTARLFYQFTTHPWRVSSCCLCEQRGSFINRGVEGWAGGSLTSCPGPPFAPPQRAPRSVLDQKKNLSHDCSPRTHTSLWERRWRGSSHGPRLTTSRACSVMANVRRKPSPV